MGLDNGIILRRFNKPIPKRFPRFDVNYRGDFEIAYWRKCWGIRNAILSIINPNNVDEFKFYLSKKDVENIIEELKKFQNKKYWDLYADSIWTYEEYKDRQKIILTNIEWLKNYMDKHPKASVYFYDSY